MTGEIRRATVPAVGIVLIAYTTYRLTETVPWPVMSAVLTVSVLALAAFALAVKVAVTWSGGGP